MGIVPAEADSVRATDAPGGNQERYPWFATDDKKLVTSGLFNDEGNAVGYGAALRRFGTRDRTDGVFVDHSPPIKKVYE